MEKKVMKLNAVSTTISVALTAACAAKKGKKGMIREVTPADKSQTKMIPFVCSVEKIFVMEGKDWK